MVSSRNNGWHHGRSSVDVHHGERRVLEKNIELYLLYVFRRHRLSLLTESGCRSFYLPSILQWARGLLREQDEANPVGIGDS